MKNTFEQPPVGSKLENLQESREKAEKTIEEEKKFVSGWLNADLSIIESIKSIRTGLTAEEIARQDADRIDWLQTKAEKEELSKEEIEELEFRKNGDCFVDEYNDKETSPSMGGRGSASWLAALTEQYRMYIEEWKPTRVIRGFMGDKGFWIKKQEAPSVVGLDRDENGEKYPTIVAYEGEMDGKKLSKQKIEELFNKYYNFAKQRSRELRILKAEKEKEKFGKAITSTDDPVLEYDSTLKQDLEAGNFGLTKELVYGSFKNPNKKKSK